MFLCCSIIFSALIALLCAWARSAKLEIRHRVLHIRYVIVTMAYSIAGIFLFSKILQLINWFVSLPIIRNLLYAITPPGNISAGFYWIITLLCCVILMLAYCLLIHLIGAIWVKPLSRKDYLNKPFFLEKLLNAIAGLFYEIRETGAFLPPNKANVGKWVRVMRIVFACILAAESLFIGLYLNYGWKFLGDTLPPLLVKSAYMLPVLSYIVLEQIELFFAADIKKGQILIETDHIGVKIFAFFDRLAQEYARLFAGRSLISYYTGNSKPTQEELHAGRQVAQKDECENGELLDALCRMVECVCVCKSHYVNGLVKLVNGQNLAVFDSPWGEFDPYYLAYIQHRMSLGETTLVLCDTEGQVERIQKRFTETFRKLNVATPIWRIHSLDTVVDGQTDMLICTEEQLLKNPLHKRFPEFNRHLSMVVVLDAYGLLCRADVYLSRITNAFVDRSLQFVFFIPENSTDICNILREKFDEDSIGICTNQSENDQSNTLFWREESIYKPQLKLSARLYHDFGVSHTIAVVAAKHDVTRVHVLAPETVPLQTYYDLVTGEYDHTLTTDYLKRESVNLQAIIHNNDYSVSSPNQVAFSVVYDEYNNLLNVAKMWSSYGGNESMMLHVVSAPYMLRDYFACNIESLLPETSGIQMIVPEDALNMRDPAIALLLRMREGVETKEVFAFAEQFGLEQEFIEQILEKLLDLACGTNHKEVYSCFSFAECEKPTFENGSYRYFTSVFLTDEELYNRLCEMTEEFVCVKAGHTYEETLPIYKGDLHNRFLPKQCVSFGNARYRIESVSDGTLHLSAESTVSMEERYTPIYSITELEKLQDLPGHTVSSEALSAEYFQANVTREIREYFAYPGVMDFASSAASISTVALEEPIVETKAASCLKLTIPCPLEDCSEKVANTLCFLLKGAMETFLPKNHKDLLIFSNLDKQAVCKGVSFDENSGFLEDPIPSDLLLTPEQLPCSINPQLCRLIPQVSGKDLEANTAEQFHIYIVHYSEIDIGVLPAIAADLDRILLTVLKYLKWAEGLKNDTAGYLRFGYSRIPGIFDSVGTVACLSEIVSEEIAKINPDSGEIEDDSHDLRCSFCGRAIPVTGKQFDDNRFLCVECANHCTTSQKEIKELLAKAVDTLEDHYGVVIPKTRVAFKSATSIRAASGGGGLGRVLGFYNLRRREVWVERGGPEPCVLSTLMHELTHAWQHANINMNIDLMYIEGHTSYVEVECLRLLKQHAYADYLEKLLMIRDDEYGKGYRFWKDYMRNSPDKNIFHCIQGEEF